MPPLPSRRPPTQLPTQRPTQLRLRIVSLSPAFSVGNKNDTFLVNGGDKLMLRGGSAVALTGDVTAFAWEWTTRNASLDLAAAGPYLTVPAGQLLAGETYRFTARVDSGHTVATAVVRAGREVGVFSRGEGDPGCPCLQRP
jgi:hypothetical protein